MTTRDFTLKVKDTNLSQWPLMKYKRNAKRNLHVVHNISKHYEILPCYPFKATVQSRNATFLRAYCKIPGLLCCVERQKKDYFVVNEIIQYTRHEMMKEVEI